MKQTFTPKTPNALWSISDDKCPVCQKSMSPVYIFVRDVATGERTEVPVMSCLKHRTVLPMTNKMMEAQK